MPLCQCCRQDRQQLYCARCLREGISTNQALFRKVDGQRADALARANRALDPPGSRGEHALRRLRADIAASERRCAALRAQVAQKESDIAAAPNPAHGAALDDARHNMSRARTALERRIAEVEKQQQGVTRRLVHARRVLVREAIEVFGLQEGRRGWEIAGAVLPSPELFRLCPAVQINAALTHIVHLVSLLTDYLGLALPFTPHYPTRPHVGRPLISPNLPFVATTKYRDKHVLYMSSSASVTRRKSGAGAVNLRSSVLGGLSGLTGGQSHAPASIDKAKINKHRETLIAFALLAHSVAYMAWSQGVPGIGIEDDLSSDSDEPFEPQDRPGDDTANPFYDPPDKSRVDLRASTLRARTPKQSNILLPATQPLPLLAALADSPSLGHRTHEPAGPDVTVRHLGFSLDVGKLVSSVLDMEAKKWGRKEEEGSEWDLVEGDEGS